MVTLRFISVLCLLIVYGYGFPYKSFLNSLNDPLFDRNTIRIGVDYGPNLIGIATTNILGAVTPITTINNQSNQTIICYQILNLVKREQALEIIVGVPLDKKGIMSYQPETFNGKLCMKFASVLACITKKYYPTIKVIMFDESYTTKEAQRRIDDGKLKTTLDAMAAACLLERYIDDEGGGSLIAKPFTWPLSEGQEMFDYDDVREHIKATYYSDESSGGTEKENETTRKRKYFFSKKFSENKKKN